MKEILEKYAEEIRAIKIEYDILKDLTRNSERLKKEEEELRRELASIGDQESGFYKDLLEKVNEKHDEFIEANNERMSKDKKVNQLISTIKEMILREIAQKKQFIDENRNINLGNIDLEALKTEKEIELMNLLEGKVPKERFIELHKLGKEIEEKFNRNNLEAKFEQVDIETEEKAAAKQADAIVKNNPAKALGMQHFDIDHVEAVQRANENATKQQQQEQR